MLSRRLFLKLSAVAGTSLLATSLRGTVQVQAVALTPELSDPALQPKFINTAPNALHPDFIFQPKKGKIPVAVGPTIHQTGLVDAAGKLLDTPIFGYGYKEYEIEFPENPQGKKKDGKKGGKKNQKFRNDYTWPGRTFEVQQGESLKVEWQNELTREEIHHVVPVDTSLHWAYSLPGYADYSLEKEGIPIVPHLHGGHTDAIYDGNPEYFFSHEWKVRGPRWVSKKYKYANDQPAGTLWYHDHTLGITRLNVYAGLAGFYIIRDDMDTGKVDNPLGLPAYPYELAYAIQDRMFRNTGELFYPAFPDEPFYADFITGEGATLPGDLFPNGGPTALAEFFGDHMVVNGLIWPKADVEPRNYRMRLLNGCDSRFMVIRFRIAASPTATDLNGAGTPLPFYVIGSDQGLAASATQTETLVFEPGGRYDIVFDFSNVPAGSRVIMENIGGDAPFGGDHGEALDPDDLFPDRQTDRIMAFDVTLPFDSAVPDAFNPAAVAHYSGNANPVTHTRKVALFEGMDEFGRLQPLLGTAEEVIDVAGNAVTGSLAWHSPTTENPELGATEIWEIYNATGDAHPVHLHLVNFQIIDRQEFTANVIEQPIVQHNGAVGTGFRLENIALGALVPTPAGYVENAPKDMVTALPGQVTRIKATFDKPGRYVWHCHILSHEDHEMMRVLHVGPGANDMVMGAQVQTDETTLDNKIFIPHVSR